MSKDYTLNQAFNFYFLDAYLIDDRTIPSQYESEFLESQENEKPSGQPEESEKENLPNGKRENVNKHAKKRKQDEAKTEKATKKAKKNKVSKFEILPKNTHSGNK